MSENKEAEKFLENLPSRTNAAVAMVNETLKKMPPGAVSASLPAAVKGIDAGEIGEAVNSLALLLSAMHKEAPPLFEDRMSDSLSELLAGVIATIDVEALHEATKGSAEEIRLIMSKLIDKILEDPIKAGGLILAVAPLINVVIKSLAEGISKVNNLPAEVIPLIVSAVMEELDTAAVGELLNSAAQFLNGMNREDPELLPRILPGMLSGLDYKAVTELFCPATGLTAAVVKSLDGKKLGEAISLHLPVLDTAHKENPTLLADIYSPFITDLISSTDFAELGEALEGSSEDILQLVRASSAVLLTNLGKLMNIVALLPAVISLTVKSLKETLPPVEGLVAEVLPLTDFSPEVVDETVSSMPLIRDVDAREIGELVNSLLGMMKSLLHTVGILLGEEAPMTRELISQKLRDAFSAIDPEKLAATTTALCEAAEAVMNTVTDVVMENPAFIPSAISATPAIMNLMVRSAGRAVSKIAEVSPDLLEKSLSEAVDAGEVSRLLNSLIRTMNKIHETNPGLLTASLSRIIGGVDASEARKLGSYLGDDLRSLLGQA